jgi:hypothetical protein
VHNFYNAFEPVIRDIFRQGDAPLRSARLQAAQTLEVAPIGTKLVVQ